MYVVHVIMVISCTSLDIILVNQKKTLIFLTIQTSYFKTSK